MTIPPSPYQAAIYDWITNGTGSLVVEAVAGSGKTTTLAQICRTISRDQRVRVFMFNRDISEAFKTKVRLPNVHISTYNSAGWQALLRHLGAKVDVEKYKTSNLIREQLEDSDRRAYEDPLKALLGLAKASGIGCLVGGETWGELIDQHDLEFEWLIPPRLPEKELDAHLLNERQRVIQLARDLLLTSNAAALEQFEWRLDYDDQLYLPILWDLPLPTYDWVLVDELQDTNAIQQEILKRSLKPGGRLIGVGDRHQAIYAWRGAHADAMDLIRSEFHALELPLSVCYRCAKVIVEKAQTIVPQIEAAPDAIEGILYEDVKPEFLSKLSSTDAILCRNNAPLVSTAYQLIAQGVGVQIRGKDIGDGLIKLIDKLGALNVEDLEEKLRDYQTKETKRYRKAQQESKAQGVEDRVACITTIISALPPARRTCAQIVVQIKALFGVGDKPLLTLSTIHKAKGQEWPRVAIIRSDLLPSCWATKDWQIQQERNLQYVAWTRAQETLLIVDDKPEWLRKKEMRERNENLDNEVQTDRRWGR
jgi:superfamily I DNA/RNA helicase